MIDLIPNLKEAIASDRKKLAEMEQLASGIAALKQQIARYEAALLALEAPQSPDGRKRIAAARRTRQKKAATIAMGWEAISNARPCSECHSPINAPDLGRQCPVPACDAVTHPRLCTDAHAIWHAEREEEREGHHG